ncbi:MAG TPA: ParB/RepB/Spo0J family partition protein [Acidocella sp.]|nr:ParB/RepB/Spo0J family partition protein [Acidocella sp.]
MSAKEPRKPLGRGLAALLGEAAAPASVTALGVQHLAVDLLEPSPFQPRQEMAEDALQELADSIAQRGILQPLLVRPKPGVPGHYQIIAGERRWRASQRAQLHEVPVLVRELTDGDAMAAGLVENLQRENLNAVEEAEGYKRLTEEFKLSHDKLGDAVGKSRSHITNVMRLLQLPPPVQQLLKEGLITTGHAKALLTHPDPVKAAKEVVKRGLSVRQTEALVKAAGRSLSPQETTRTPREHQGDNGEIAALAESLSGRLGLKVDVKFNGKGGALVLNYTDLDQLDSLLALLNG